MLKENICQKTLRAKMLRPLMFFIVAPVPPWFHEEEVTGWTNTTVYRPIKLKLGFRRQEKSSGGGDGKREGNNTE